MFQWGTFSALLFFGFLSSLQDFITRRVSNRIIFPMMSGAVLFLFLEVFFNRSALPKPWVGFLSIHLFLCALTALFLWYQRIWPAGDAKIFFIFSILVVMIRPWLWSFPYWTFLHLAINIFFPSVCFILSILIYQKFHELKKMFSVSVREWIPGVKRALRVLCSRLPANRRVLLTLIGNIIIIPTMIQSFQRVVPHSFFKPFQFIVYVFLYLFWGTVYKYLQERYILFIVVLLLAEFAHKIHESIFTIVSKNLYFSCGFMIFASTFGILSYYLKMLRVRRSETSNLNQGDILSDKSWSEMEELCAKTGSEHEFLRYADGLSQEDIAVIRSSCPAEKEVIVCETRPFAFWIFIGALWTLFSAQTFPQWLISLRHVHF